MDEQIQTIQPQAKKFSVGKIIAIVVGILILVGGLAAGLILVRKQQTLKEEASQCTEQCPASDGILKNCHPAEADGSPQESRCDRKGRIESCGNRQYCCPSVNGTWTTSLSACSTTETNCNDVLDNDSDGKTDCLDSDCTNSTYCETEVSLTQSISPTATSSPTQTTTPTATKTPSPSRITTSPTVSATVSPPIPDSGIGTPTILGFGLGTILFIISLALIF